MSEWDQRVPAFPLHPGICQAGQKVGDTQGMTLRDYFAAAALQGFLANDTHNPIRFRPEHDASYCYTIADEMLKARGNEGGE